MGSKVTTRTSESPMRLYVKSISKAQLLTHAEEVTLSGEIKDLRLSLWRTSLSYLPFVSVVSDLLREQGECQVDLSTVESGSQALRRRETRVNKDAFDQSADEAALLLLAADQDGVFADFVYNRLDMIFSGQRQIDLYWPRNGRPFSLYKTSVRNAHGMLQRKKERFINANLRLVLSIASRYAREALSLQDMVQEGNIGLIKAIYRFDAGRGLRFSTYATWWIRHAIGRAVANTGRLVRLPVGVSGRVYKLRRTRLDFVTANGRFPTDDELAVGTGFDLEMVRRLSLLTTEVYSLDSPLEWADGEVGGATFIDLIEDGPEGSFDQDIDAVYMSKILQDSMSKLSEIEQDVIRNRFAIDCDNELTLSEIGIIYNLSRERIRQIQNAAILKLRNDLANKRIGGCDV